MLFSRTSITLLLFISLSSITWIGQFAFLLFCLDCLRFPSNGTLVSRVERILIDEKNNKLIGGAMWAFIIIIIIIYHFYNNNNYYYYYYN